MLSDRRHYKRIPFHGSIHMRCGSTDHDLEIQDISMKGVLVHIPPELDLPRGCQCRLRLQLSGTRQAIVMDGILSHVTKEHGGFEWQHIDLDDFARLRELLLLNSGDEGLIDRELAEMIHQSSKKMSTI